MIRAAAGVLVLSLLVAGCVTVEAPSDAVPESDTTSTTSTTVSALFETVDEGFETMDGDETMDEGFETMSEDETMDEDFETMNGEEVLDALTTTTAPLRGDPIDFGPSEGDMLSVVGVDHDDVLNVRDAPFGEIIATLTNQVSGDRDDRVIVREISSNEIVAVLDVAGIIAVGNTRALPTTVWHEVRAGSVNGWASGAYLSPLGSTHDVTQRVVEAISETPEAATLTDIGQAIAYLFASDGEVQSRITISSEPVVDENFGELTMDVVGLADDSLRGYRLFITVHAAQNNGYGTGPYTLLNVRATTLCDSHRGVTAEGLCQ